MTGHSGHTANASQSYTFASRTSQRTDQSLQKSMPAQPHGHCKLDTADLRQKRRAAHNKGFAIAGVPCFADTFVQGGSSVLRMKFSAKTPRHRKPPKRYASA
jgi:hypothetical protein